MKLQRISVEMGYDDRQGDHLVVEPDDVGPYVAVDDLVSWIKRQSPQYSALLVALGEDVEEAPAVGFTYDDFIQWRTERGGVK